MSTSRTLHPEDQIAQYRVVGPLGAGGMGEVYLAQDQSLERSVALKVLPLELTRSDDRLRRFVQEAKSASALNHPNIVTIYEIGQEPVRSASGEPDSGPLHYISMELISGKTLSAKIHEEKTDLKSLVGYLAQAAEGIAKAHAVGIIHRDLKPGNIMVSDDGYAKVLDFGLAKLLDKTAGPNEATEIADRTSEGAVMGTVSYMSPEQVQGKPVDARADVFSFGCILYEAATRQRPFVAESNVEIMHKILHEKPRAVEELNPHVPAELRRVIRRCLAKQPEQRAQSMKDIAIELREVFDEYDSLSSSATSATLTAGGGVMPLSSRRKKNIWPVVAMTAAAAAIAAFVWVGVLHRGAKSPGQDFQNMKISAQTNRGDVSDCAISPDGRYLAYITGRNGNPNSLRVRQVATGSDVEILPAQNAALEFPSFSPDGNYVYFCKRKPDAPNYRMLMYVPSLGGREQQKGFDVDTRLAFSPDGKRACFARNYPQAGYAVLMMLDLETGKDKELVRIAGPGGPGGAPSWSSDGKLIAVSLLVPPPRGGTTVVLVNPDSGERRDFYKRQGAFLGNISWLPDNTGIAMVGFDLAATLTNQLFLLTYPQGQLRRITNDFNNYAGISAGGTDEALSSTRSTALSNLYLVETTSNQPVPLTKTASPENSPVGVNVMGDHVFFGSLHNDFLGVSTVPLTGGEPTTFETGPGHCLVIRAEGGRIVMQRIDADNQMHIWTINPDGTGLKQLTSSSGEVLRDVSYDGKWFTYAVTDSTRGIWVAPTDGGPGRLFSAKATQGVGGFSPDGKYIVTSEYETDSAGLIRTVFKVSPIDGSTPPETLRLPQRAGDFEGTPSRSIVSFIDAADPNRNLFYAEMGGKVETRQLTRFKEGIITDHQWSTDGKHIAVVRRLADGDNIWLLNADGTPVKQLTHFIGLQVLGMAWSHDDAHLVANAGQFSFDVVLLRNFK
jgi:serine/threonine protein kinase/Tol biopolymer transport system component